jgi:hypothetical protein
MRVKVPKELAWECHELAVGSGSLPEDLQGVVEPRGLLMEPFSRTYCLRSGAPAAVIQFSV